jgi:hypothetical protein
VLLSQPLHQRRHQHPTRCSLVPGTGEAVLHNLSRDHAKPLGRCVQNSALCEAASFQLCSMHASCCRTGPERHCAQPTHTHAHTHVSLPPSQPAQAFSQRFAVLHAVHGYRTHGVCLPEHCEWQQPATQTGHMKPRHTCMPCNGICTRAPTSAPTQTPRLQSTLRELCCCGGCVTLETGHERGMGWHVGVNGEQRVSSQWTLDLPGGGCRLSVWCLLSVRLSLSVHRRRWPNASAASQLTRPVRGAHRTGLW